MSPLTEPREQSKVVLFSLIILKGKTLGLILEGCIGVRPVGFQTFSFFPSHSRSFVEGKNGSLTCH